MVMLMAQLRSRHTAFRLAQDRKVLWFAKSRHLQQKLIRYPAEKFLRPNPIGFEESCP